MTYWHPLLSHPSNTNSAQTKYSVQANASLLGNRLIISFKVNDPARDIIWPEPDQLMQRDFLWESTCFEVFINHRTHNAYFELNLSPSLAWNLYQFSDYRTPHTIPPQRVREPALLKFEVLDQTVSAEIDLARLHLVGKKLNLGLTAVIQTQNSLEYLALNHPIAQADFHHASGWTLSLSPREEFHDSHGQ